LVASPGNKFSNLATFCGAPRHSVAAGLLRAGMVPDAGSPPLWKAFGAWYSGARRQLKASLIRGDVAY
jgi:hypothetical protein